MNEIIQVQDEYYILARSSLADDRTRILKHGETFAIFDRYGDIQPIGFGKQGVFHEGTRHLSRMQLTLGSQRPLFLSSTVLDEYGLLAVDLTNPDVRLDGQVDVPHGTVHIFRSKFLWAGVSYERFRVANYGPHAIDITLVLQFDADFADIFEVRGLRRAERGRRLDDVVNADHVVLAYEGLDGVTRRTRLEWSPAPAELTASRAVITARLPTRGDSTFYLTTCFEAVCDPRDESARNDYERTFALAHDHRTAARADDCRVSTSNEQFNDWLNRSIADLHLLVTDTPHGGYPYAGVPWFSTVVRARRHHHGARVPVGEAHARAGRAAVSRGDCRPTRSTRRRDAEPGKILHEMRARRDGRHSERSRSGATTAASTRRRSSSCWRARTTSAPRDRDLIRSAVAASRARARMDRHVRGSRRRRVHRVLPAEPSAASSIRDGRIRATRSSTPTARSPSGPIALCEVQGYVYAARLGAARSRATRSVCDARADALARQADALRAEFDEAFWCDDLGTLRARARRREARRAACARRTPASASSPGSRPRARAPRRGRRCSAMHFYSGWGIRTLAADEARYNPMSYHNGSVWPHDNGAHRAAASRATASRRRR